MTIDDQLLRAAKLMAARDDRTVSSVLEQALRDHLERATDAEKRRRSEFDLPVFSGGFAVDPSNNAAVRDIMEGG